MTICSVCINNKVLDRCLRCEADGYSDFEANEPVRGDCRIPVTAADPINSPAHYQHGGIETIDVIRAVLTPDEFRGYLKGTILKYRERAEHKGKRGEDYAKAKWFYDRLEDNT